MARNLLSFFTDFSMTSGHFDLIGGLRFLAAIEQNRRYARGFVSPVDRLLRRFREERKVIRVQCEKCGGALGKWDSIGLDWVMYCINCGAEFYTREGELKAQWLEAMNSGRRAFVLRPRVMALARR